MVKPGRLGGVAEHSIMENARPKGFPEEDWKSEFPETMDILESHLGLIAEKGNVWDGERKFRISDQNTLFQLQIQTALEKTGSGDTGILGHGLPDEPPEGLLEEQQKAEGFALEDFTAKWLLHLGYYRANMNLQDGKSHSDEIDAAAWTLNRTLSKVAIASCKRNPARLSPRKTAAGVDRPFSAFRKRLAKFHPNEPYSERIECRCFAVSPSAPDRHRRDLAAVGVEHVGFREMAEMLGIGPTPHDRSGRRSETLS